MEQYGFDLRFYPSEVVGKDPRLVVEYITWETGKPTVSKDLLSIPMKSDLQALAKGHARAWIISILELAGAAVAATVMDEDGGWNSGTCASPNRASETLTDG